MNMCILICRDMVALCIDHWVRPTTADRSPYYCWSGSKHLLDTALRCHEYERRCNNFKRITPPHHTVQSPIFNLCRSFDRRSATVRNPLALVRRTRWSIRNCVFDCHRHVLSDKQQQRFVVGGIRSHALITSHARLLRPPPEGQFWPECCPPRVSPVAVGLDRPTPTAVSPTSRRSDLRVLIKLWCVAPRHTADRPYMFRERCRTGPMEALWLTSNGSCWTTIFLSLATSTVSGALDKRCTLRFISGIALRLLIDYCLVVVHIFCLQNNPFSAQISILLLHNSTQPEQ